MKQRDGFLTAEQVAERLGVRKNKVSAWLKAGVLPFERSPWDGRLKLIPVEKVDALQKARPNLAA